MPLYAVLARGKPFDQRIMRRDPRCGHHAVEPRYVTIGPVVGGWVFDTYRTTTDGCTWGRWRWRLRRRRLRSRFKLRAVRIGTKRGGRGAYAHFKAVLLCFAVRLGPLWRFATRATIARPRPLPGASCSARRTKGCRATHGPSAGMLFPPLAHESAGHHLRIGLFARELERRRACGRSSRRITPLVHGRWPVDGAQGPVRPPRKTTLPSNSCAS